MQTLNARKATAPKMVNVYRVVFSMGGIRSTSGTHHATMGEAYSEVATLSQAGFTAVVELAQVRVLTVPIA